MNNPVNAERSSGQRKIRFLLPLLTSLALIHGLRAEAQPSEFRFGVMTQAFNAASGETALREAIARSNEQHLIFIVGNGIKTAAEPCSDKLYSRRKSILQEAKKGLILSLAASDWAECKKANGKSAAIERLNRLRELFFADDMSFGAEKIALVHQSSAAKFRSYAENARWSVGNILFATINLPANNNHYRADAGRNSEFEDRLIANRDWLQRIFSLARRHQFEGIVLFSDADPLALPEHSSLAEVGRKRDGFAETRRLITALAGKFDGSVLLVHGQRQPKAATETAITWDGNLGSISANATWLEVAVHPGSPALFTPVVPVVPRNNKKEIIEENLAARHSGNQSARQFQ